MTARAHETERMIRDLLESQKKTDEQLKKTDREIEKVNKLVAGISDGWGRLTESLAIISVGEAFKQAGIEIVKTTPRVWSRKDGEEMDLDLLAVGKKGRKHITLVVESKSTLRVKDVDAVIDDMGMSWCSRTRRNSDPDCGERLRDSHTRPIILPHLLPIPLTIHPLEDLPSGRL